MPEEDNKILRHNHGEKSMRAPFVIYVDLESLFEKMSTCDNNPEKLSTTKLDYYRGKNCMKNFCLDLKEHVTKIISYKKRNDTINKGRKKMHRRQKKCYICKKGFSTDNDNKKYHNVKDHCHYTGKYRGAAHIIFNLKYKVPKEIPVVFHNGSTYDYHFIIKELAEKLEGDLECLGENTEKYIIFSVRIKKRLDNGKSVTYKIKFIDSFRFMSSTLSSLVDNLSEGLHNEKCTDCKSRLGYMTTKDEQLIFRCFERIRIIRKNLIKN